MNLKNLLLRKSHEFKCLESKVVHYIKSYLENTIRSNL